MRPQAIFHARQNSGGLSFFTNLVVATCSLGVLPLSATVYIDSTTNNGSFESGSLDQPADWQAGFTIEALERIENMASVGAWSLVIGNGDLGTKGGLLDTGMGLTAGDELQLSFDWRSAYEWDAADVINWRVFATDDDTLSGSVLLIGEGTVTGYSDGVFREEVVSSLTVPASADGRHLWCEFWSSTASLEFARVDNVRLEGLASPEPPAGVALPDAPLRAFYPAEDNALDYSDFLQDGIWSGIETYTTGVVAGAAFDLDGLDSSVELPLSLPVDFTLSFWLKTTASGPSGTDWPDGLRILEAGMNTSALMGVSLAARHILFGAGASGPTIASTAPVNDGNWHHVAVAREAASGWCFLYLDGELQGTALGPQMDPAGINRVVLGNTLAADNAFTGGIDQCMLFSGVLNADAVASLHARPVDHDGDGARNYLEQVAATDWLSAGSRFAVNAFTQNSSTGEMRLSLDGRATRSYALLRNENLDTDDWTQIQSAGPLGFHQPVTFSDFPAMRQNRVFYRVSVEGRGPAVETPPNVLIVMIDDLGWGDLSANPEAVPEAHTPNLDRLANEGVFFSDAYVTAPTCSASRAGFNTGLHQNRWDNNGGWTPGLPSSATTLAERLRDNGYITGKVGKNDFGTNLTVPDRFTDRTYPANHGYDRFLGFTAHAHDYWFHETGGNNVNGSSAHAGPLQWHDALVVPEISPQRRAFTGPDDPNNLDEDPDQYYLTDLITDEALNFLQDHGDGQDPFFLHVSFNAVHHLTPQVPEKYLQMEAARLGWDSYPTEAEVYDPHTNTPSNPSNYHDFYNYWNKVYLIGAQAMRRYYLANLRAVDENMGRLLDALDEAGLADNTLVFFFGDNGGAPETGANNGPLMGSKYNVFEGGIRIPFMARWPRTLPAGIRYPYVVSTLDILPTALEAAGMDPVSGLDGVSLLDPVLENRPTVADTGDPSLDARTLFWRWQTGNYAVRRGPWKLVDSETGRDASLFSDEVWFDYGIVGKRSLFNLDDSVSETAPNDRIAAEPGLADELQALYDAWVDSL